MTLRGSVARRAAQSSASTDLQGARQAIAYVANTDRLLSFDNLRDVLGMDAARPRSELQKEDGV